jgi:chitin deacetylase
MNRPVALTFDDGPGPSTPRLLDVLGRHGAPATFFVLGRNLLGDALGGDREAASAIIVRAVQEGHVIGNHTVTHARALAPHDLFREVEECDELVRELYARAGRPAPSSIPIRLPFAHYRDDHPRGIESLTSIGRSHCSYTCAFYDWKPERTAERIVSGIQAHVQWEWVNRRTPVLLLHDAGQGMGDDGEDVGVVRDVTVEAVDRACTWLRSKKCTFQTVLECAPECLVYKPEGETPAPEPAPAS